MGNMTIHDWLVERKWALLYKNHDNSAYAKDGVRLYMYKCSNDISCIAGSGESTARISCVSKSDKVCPSDCEDIQAVEAALKAINLIRKDDE